MEQIKQPQPPRELSPAEQERKARIEQLARKVLDDFKSQIGGKEITIDSRPGGELKATVTENMANKGHPLWDSQVANTIFVREPGANHGVILNFFYALVSKEGKALLSAIMEKQKIPLDMWEDVRKEIVSWYR